MSDSRGILNLPRGDTIAAVATPRGISALGIVRLSGERSLEIARGVLDSSVDLRSLAGGTARAVSLNIGKDIVDTGVVTVWRAPKSFTGEDSAEFTIHGSPLLLTALLARLVELGARPSAPGEFTLRAILNGKISIAEAGAIDAIINSANIFATKAISRTLSGELSRKIAEILDLLEQTELRTTAQTEFPEHFNEPSCDELIDYLHAAVRPLESLIDALRNGERFAREMTVVIAGPPNVGKSTLANALIGAKRSIVHHAPGTTRDIVEAHCTFGEVSAVLVDTAGIRETGDEVELIGVDLAHSRLSQADLAIVVLDGSAPASPEEDKLLRLIDQIPHLLVLNKCDKGILRESAGAIKASALTGEGVEHIRQRIAQSLAPPEDEALWAGAWQIERLKSAHGSLHCAIEACELGLADAALIELSSAIGLVREAAGLESREEIIERVLAGFCIGK